MCEVNFYELIVKTNSNHILCVLSSGSNCVLVSALQSLFRGADDRGSQGRALPGRGVPLVTAAPALETVVGPVSALALRVPLLRPNQVGPLAALAHQGLLPILGTHLLHLHRVALLAGGGEGSFQVVMPFL